MKAMKRFTRLVLALALLLSSGGLASAALTQEDYAVLDQYSGLTNFDLDQNGGIYVITSRKSAAKLIRLNDSGVEIASFDVTAGAAEITVSPAGGAVFYTVSDADKDNRVYKVTSAGADSYKEGFTFGGVPIVIDKIEAVSDDKVLIAWNAEYYEDAEFPNWLPKTVKIGQFSFSAAGEPEEVWTWAPQWEDGETNFDGNPYVKRLGDSWRYYLYFNPKTDAIVIYSTHYEKFFHTPTGRNHYSRNVTHVYEAGVSSFAEVPKSDFPDWANAFQEPFYTNGGVLMYRVNNSFTERPNFTQRVYLAKQGAREIIYDEYVESWQDGQGGAVNIADASNLPQAHIELISNYLADYRNNLYVINGIRNINTEETISLAFVKFTSDRSGDITPGETIVGTSGNDHLIGTDNDDTIIGGAGTDRLEGGLGDDTYVWNLGDGSDTIFDNSGSNALELGEGVASADVALARVGQDDEDLMIVLPGGGSVTIEGWFSSEANQLSEIRFADGTTWTRQQINDSEPGPEEPVGQTINGTSGADTLTGGKGNDRVNGLGGNDTITGGKGNDRLEGGVGNDTYIYNPGDGSDTIYDNSGTNILRIEGNINPADVILTRSGTSSNDAVFILPDGSRITVERWYSGALYQLSEIRFANGTAWTRANINGMSAVFKGTDEAETITGTSGGDTIYGYGENDTLTGLAGNDTLIGGLGDDRLEGGVGNDAYIYNLGDGSDTIYDNSGTNILRIEGAINPSAVKFTRGGTSFNDAVFIMPDGERITLERWYSGAIYQLSEVRFSDGTVWTRAAINAFSPVFEGTEAEDTINGSPGNDAIYGYGGDDALNGNAGNDTLIGGPGDDRLEGGAGNDTYVWSLGDGIDTIYDNSGTNILTVGSGVSPADVTFTRGGTGNNDAVFIMPGGGRVTIERWFAGLAYRLSEVRFDNGTVWTRTDITNMSAQFEGSDEGETLTGTSGNDTLIGGPGDDRLEGGAGNDTYVWNLGDGNDTIYDNSGTNILRIGEGVDPETVKFSRSGTNYVNAVFIMPDGERITIERWYSGTAYQLSEVRFSNGAAWTRANINGMNALLEGTEAGETISGTTANDAIYGYEGDDILIGNAGNDILAGGVGDDRLEGGAGNDTYVWTLGDGNDTISDNSGTNVLLIEGVDPEDIEYTRSGTSNYDAVFIMPGNERIAVERWFYTTTYQLSEVRFDGGTIWTRAAINSMSAVLKGTDAAETIAGTSGNDTVYGYGGNDAITGAAGNDTLIGGPGDDRVEGGAGSDTYAWEAGDGTDTIYDNAGTNVLQIGEGIDQTAFTLTRSGNNLIIQFNDESGGGVTIDRWYLGTVYQLNNITFADGTIWTRADIINRYSGGNENAVPLGFSL